MGNIFYIILLFILVFISSFSQILFKQNALKQHASLTREYINIQVIGAYFIYAVTVIISIWLLKYIELSTFTVIETTSYVYILILSRIFFNETISVRKTVATALIISGVIITII